MRLYSENILLTSCVPACRVYWVYDGLVGWVVLAKECPMCVRVFTRCHRWMRRYYYYATTCSRERIKFDTSATLAIGTHQVDVGTIDISVTIAFRTLVGNV